MAEASGNPFLRSTSAIMEFGVAQNILSQLTADRAAPADGLAGAKAERYQGLIQAIDQGEPATAGQIMADLLRP